jgi:cytochrome c
MKATAKLLLLSVTVVVLAGSWATACASDKSLACVEMVEKAQTLILDKGQDYACKVFCASKGPFINQDLYVFACSIDNKLLAHPYKRNLIGQSVNDFEDVKGKQVFRAFREMAQQRGSGWVDYWWPKPGEKGEFAKTTYIKFIPKYNMYVGVGYYKTLQISQESSRPEAR